MTSVKSAGTKEKETFLIIAVLGTRGGQGEGAIYYGNVPSMEKLCAEMRQRETRRFTKDGDRVHCAGTKILRCRHYRFTLSPRALGTMYAIGNNGNIAGKKDPFSFSKRVCNTLQRINIKVED